jgi:hypothetical protein
VTPLWRRGGSVLGLGSRPALCAHRTSRAPSLVRSAFMGLAARDRRRGAGVDTRPPVPTRDEVNQWHPMTQSGLNVSARFDDSAAEQATGKLRDKFKGVGKIHRRRAGR